MFLSKEGADICCRTALEIIDLAKKVKIVKIK
jgi:hypothetical protein